MTSRLHRLLIPAAALLAVLPLLVHGPSCGHDFDFHLLSWLEAASQLAHGAFPHWAYTPAWNAGEPRFLFYPPLSWLLGATLGLILPWTLVPAAFTFVSLTIAGFSMNALARRFATPGAATLAAVFYLVNPYMLFTAYERTAYGELLAAAILPLFFAAILAEHVSILVLATPVALIWLSNAPAGVMSCYALAFLAATRLLKTENSKLKTDPTSRLQLALKVTGGTALGLALAGAYLVPAVLEQPLISANMATIQGMRIVDNTLFHHMPSSVAEAAAHDEVLHTASMIAVLLLAGIAAAAVLARRKLPSAVALPLLLLAGLIAFLLTPLSLPVWSFLPELRFLQFPWRLMALLAPILALFLAAAVPELKRPAILAIPLALCCITPAFFLFNQGCDDEDTVPARLALFHSRFGTEGTDEYTPAEADADALHPNNPGYWLVPYAQTLPGHPVDRAAPGDLPPGQAPSHLVLTEREPTYLILNRREYPIWQIRLNGQIVPPDRLGRTDGLIDVLLPAGTSTIDLEEIRTPDEKDGVTLTLCAAIAALALWRRRPSRSLAQP